MKLEIELGKKINFATEKDLEDLRLIPTYKIENSDYTLIQGEAIQQMSLLGKESVDMICVDLPYGATRNKWDKVIPLYDMWDLFHSISKPNSAIVLTATEPFASLLRMTNFKHYKYDLIWEKTIASGQLNVRHQPLRIHENILVFYKKIPTYNEQKTKGTPYSIKRSGNYNDGNYNQQKASEKINDGYRHAKSIIKCSNPRVKGGHPTQKPLELMETLIKMYSNENDMILDCCMGSGTTGLAALNNNRKFIGIECQENYMQEAIIRLGKNDT